MSAKPCGHQTGRSSQCDNQIQLKRENRMDEPLKTIVKRLATALSFTADGIQLAAEVTETLSAGHVHF
jgi:hypothetical protein